MKKFLITVAILLALVVAAEIGYLVYRDYSSDPTEPSTVPTAETTQAPTTEATTPVTTVTTEAPTTVSTTEATEVPTQAPTTEAPTEVTTEAPAQTPTEAPTEAATEPSDGSTTYLLTFAGNCTLGNTLSDAKNSASFVNTVGEDYGFPFRNVQEYFGKDDFTMVNLEGVLADSGDPIGKIYTFIGPSAYAKILTEGSIDAVSLANDHTRDFGTAGYTDTKTALEAEGVSYVEKDSSLLYVTDRGLKVGVYAVNGTLSNWDMQQEIKQLKNKGAEVIVVYFHWGDETSYGPSVTQVNYGHAAINAGADIVIGTNPHVLQPIEFYKNGIICYSLGNFSYGGNKWPNDPDTAFVQLEVIRNPNGKVEIGELYIFPCSMTSLSTAQNNFQPRLLEAGNWQYNQILRKLSDTSAIPGATTAATTSTTAAESTAGAATDPTEPAVEATTAPTENNSPDVPDLYDPQA